MIETLLGSLLGGVFRLVPEVLKFMDAKNDRAHELAMFDKQLEADKLRGQIDVARIEAQTAALDVQALIEATKAQAKQTGIRWVDALNSLVRPVLAFQWLILLWPGMIVAGYVSAIQSGVSPLDALTSVFGQEEQAMASSIAAFWLVDRSLRKMK